MGARRGGSVVTGVDAGAPRRRRPPGRPATPVLTQDKITRATLRLIGRRGQRSFTLAALAADLRVSTSALYNHAGSKAHVLLWAQDAINATIDVAGFATLPWDEALRQWARSYRDAYARYPSLVPLMAVQPITDAPCSLAMYETVTRGLLTGGWPGQDVVDVIVAVESFVFGSALDTAAPADIFDVGSQADTAPDFARAVTERERAHGRGRPGSDAAFELGLDALLDGLRRRH